MLKDKIACKTKGTSSYLKMMRSVKVSLKSIQIKTVSDCATIMRRRVAYEQVDDFIVSLLDTYHKKITATIYEILLID